ALPGRPADDHRECVRPDELPAPAWAVRRRVRARLADPRLVVRVSPARRRGCGLRVLASRPLDRRDGDLACETCVLRDQIAVRALRAAAALAVQIREDKRGYRLAAD